MGGFAWVTLATNDSYSLGALVLAHSLRQVNTVHQLAVLVTPGVTSVMREKLASVFNVVVEVNILDSKDEANLRLLKRPELGVTFTKLHCWRLAQFEKCVFLDADTMVLANADELFDKEEFSAAPDVGWPDCFNSGVFVFRPSEETYNNLVKFALERGSFDGGDQGLLNLYFSDWAYKDISKHLPFVYNTCSTACYSYLPAFKQFGGNVKIIHFIGNSKPWLQYFDSETRQVHVGADIQHLQVVVQQWWNIFCSSIHPILSPDMAPSRVPAAVHLPFHPYLEQTFHHKPNPDLSYDKPIGEPVLKNVWDPWEEYEEKIDNFENHSKQFDSTECFPNVHSENIDVPIHTITESHHNNPSTYTVEHSYKITEPFNFDNSSTNTHIHHNVSHNQASHFEVPVTHPEFNFSNQSSHPPLHDSDHFHNKQSFQPPSPEPDICTSHTNIEPGIECIQHARPHSCEPTSSVTNESALHKSNEVSDNSAGLAGAFARLTLGAPRTAEQVMLEDQLRRQGWEVGNIDYMGRDSFDNIWGKICETLNTCPAPSQVVMPQEPSHVVPVEEIKQATSLIIDTCMKTHAQVQEAIPKIDEKMTAEKIKPPVEGISDSFISQVTLLTEDTQPSIPDSSILAHATTQSQQPSIPLQKEHKEMHPKSQSISSEALVPSIPISAQSQTTTLESSISTVESATSSAAEKPLGKEFSDILDIMEMSKAGQTPLSEPPQQKTVAVELSQCSNKVQGSGTPEQLLTTGQPPIPESSKLISELVCGSRQQASATPEEPSSTINHAPKHLPAPPTSITTDEPAKPISLSSQKQPVEPSTKKEPPKLAESCVGELQKPKGATSDLSTVDSDKPAPSVVSAPVIQKSIAPETSAPPSTQVETPKASIGSSKPISSPISPKTEAEKVSTPLETPKSPGKTSGKPAATKPSEPNQKSTGPTAGPTPPPRKSTSGGGAASKKSAKGKK